LSQKQGLGGSNPLSCNMKTFTFIPKTQAEVLKEHYNLCYQGISYIDVMEKFAGKEIEVARHSYGENWFKDRSWGFLWHRYWVKRVNNIEKNGQYLLEGFE
jgi:hypothetical protein